MNSIGEYRVTRKGHSTASRSFGTRTTQEKLENEDGMFFQHLGKFLPDHMVSYTIRLYYSLL